MDLFNYIGWKRICGCVRANADTNYHPSCTNKMGSTTDNMAVVDAQEGTTGIGAQKAIYPVLREWDHLDMNSEGCTEIGLAPRPKNAVLSWGNPLINPSYRDFKNPSEFIQSHCNNMLQNSKSRLINIGPISANLTL